MEWTNTMSVGRSDINDYFFLYLLIMSVYKWIRESVVLIFRTYTKYNIKNTSKIIDRKET